MAATPTALTEPPAPRVLACLSDTPAAEVVLRAAAQTARELRAELLALHVAPPGAATRRAPATAQIVTRTLRLAADLGAQVEVAVSHQVAAAILAFAREQHASHILLGRSCCGRIGRTFGMDIVARVKAEARATVVVVSNRAQQG